MAVQLVPTAPAMRCLQRLMADINATSASAAGDAGACWACCAQPLCSGRCSGQGLHA